MQESTRRPKSGLREKKYGYKSLRFINNYVNMENEKIVRLEKLGKKLKIENMELFDNEENIELDGNNSIKLPEVLGRDESSEIFDP